MRTLSLISNLHEPRLVQVLQPWRPHLNRVRKSVPAAFRVHFYHDKVDWEPPNPHEALRAADAL